MRGIPGINVYIDASNLQGSTEACGYKKVDYMKLYNWLKTSKGAKRVYLYATYDEGDTVTQSEFETLKRKGCVTRIKEIKQYAPTTKLRYGKCKHCGKQTVVMSKEQGRRKGNCDSELTLDVINDGVRKKYKSIIVFSGDGDFARMHEYVAEVIKKKVTVYSPMSGLPGKRTSTSVKALHHNGTITLESLEGVLRNFALK